MRREGRGRGVEEFLWFQGPVAGGARGGTWGWSLVCAVCQACTQVCCEMTPDGCEGSQFPSFAHASLIGWRWPCCWLSAEDGDGVSVWFRQTLLLFSLFKIVFYFFLFGCTGSSLLRVDFLQVQRAGATS